MFKADPVKVKAFIPWEFDSLHIRQTAAAAVVYSQHAGLTSRKPQSRAVWPSASFVSPIALIFQVWYPNSALWCWGSYLHPLPSDPRTRVTCTRHNTIVSVTTSRLTPVFPAFQTALISHLKATHKLFLSFLLPASCSIPCITTELLRHVLSAGQGCSCGDDL